MNPFPSDFSSGQIFIQFLKLYVSFGIKTYNPQIPGLALYQWDQIRPESSCRQIRRIQIDALKIDVYIVPVIERTGWNSVLFFSL